MKHKFKRLIIASNNKHKIEEIKEILKDFTEEIISLKEAGIEADVEENGRTFEENAYIKAKAIHDMTGEAVLADDSGLEVYALNGAPGVYSARFAGEHGNDSKNNEELLGLLKDVPEGGRGARFTSAIVLISSEGHAVTAMGHVEGTIGYTERGTYGFGYDPLFVVPEFDRTYAELTPQEKNAISHRSKALANLREKLLNQ